MRADLQFNAAGELPLSIAGGVAESVVMETAAEPARPRIGKPDPGVVYRSSATHTR
jgi:hypothetical protein